MKARLASAGPVSRGPLHIQIRETIRRQVRDGELVDASGRLLTEAELVKHFGVSRVTIRNAIRPLVEEGMFARERGRGTFLRSNKPENWVGRLLGFCLIWLALAIYTAESILRNAGAARVRIAASEP